MPISSESVGFFAWCRRFALAAVASLSIACAGPAVEPPTELSGLWARSAAACAAGAGLVFGKSSVDLVIDGYAQPLLDKPSYRVERRLGGLRVTIRYKIAVDGRRTGSIVLEQGRDGWLRLADRRTHDPRTGSVLIRFADKDAFARLFDVGRCADEGD
jgi:hypothetical protein